MRIFGKYILNKMEGLRENEVRVRFIGMRHRVPQRLRQLMELLEERTRDCQSMTLSIAIDYGGRDELTRAVRALSQKVACGALAAVGDLESRRSRRRSIPRACRTRTSSSAHRASFESRTSCSGRATYAEYDFPETAWPDFGVEAFAGAIEGYRLRSRRFGEVVDVPARAGFTT